MLPGRRTRRAPSRSHPRLRAPAGRTGPWQSLTTLPAALPHSLASRAIFLSFNCLVVSGSGRLSLRRTASARSPTPSDASGAPTAPTKPKAAAAASHRILLFMVCPTIDLDWGESVQRPSVSFVVVRAEGYRRYAGLTLIRPQSQRQHHCEKSIACQANDEQGRGPPRFRRPHCLETNPAFSPVPN